MKNSDKSVTALSPAKINLSLYVISNKLKNKKSSDYHDIHSVMQALNLFEKVTVSLSESPNIVVSILNNSNSIPTDQTNTAYKAAVEFFKFTGIINSGIGIEIEKNIPVGAGLAGGSADAAATLFALNELFKTNLSLPVLGEIGSRVGADVPFCIFGGTMLATGIGTHLELLPWLKDCFFLLAKPELSISTKEAYSMIDGEELIFPPISKKIEQELEGGSLSGVAANLENHFELCLEMNAARTIMSLRSSMLQYGALGSRMTGSGSTVFGIFDNKGDAERCKAQMEKSDSSIWSYVARPYNFGTRLYSE